MDGEVLMSTEDGVFVPPESRGLGMVFQSYAVWPHMTVFKNVVFPLKVRGGFSRDECRRRTLEALELVGLESLLMCYLTEPEFVKEVGRMFVSYQKELHRRAIEAGVEIVILGDDYAHKLGTIMSPQHFKEFILPGLREVVENVKACGAYCVKHTDGNVWEIMDDIVNCSVDGVGSLEPGADMDLARVKKMYPEVTVVGNVDVDHSFRVTVQYPLFAFS